MVGKQKLRRILIDCSFINFAGQPSGIPRVVLAYIEVGYAWGLLNGVEVIPVVPTETGLFIVRPIPGRGAPETLTRSASKQSRFTAALALRRLLHAAQQWLALSLFHLAFLVLALLNIRTLWPFEQQIRREIGGRYGLPTLSDGEDAQSTVQINVRPGDLLFCPAYWHDIDPAIYQDIKHRGAKIVTLVHDILPILFEKFYQAPWRYMFRDNLRATFSYADALFCVSRYTADAVKEFGHRQNCSPVPILTAYNGFEPLADAGYMADYAAGNVPHLFGSEKLRAVTASERAPYLMVGSVEPKKGHIPVIRCFEGMWRGGYERNLVIVGRRGWMCDGIVATIENSAYYGRKLFWLSDLSDFDLAFAYMKAHGLIFSSIGEGFGIPMIEAAFYGKPTIVLDTLIAREVLGDIGLYFQDARQLVDRICSLEEDEAYREHCARAQGLNWPTWSGYTPQVFDALRVAYEGGPLPDVVPRSSPV